MAILTYRVVVNVSASGDVVVGGGDDGAPLPAELAEKVRLMVRAVYRQAKSDGAAPAWRIVRWRPRASVPSEDA
jgi:hypothetical protein